jgi:ATP-dependent Zn protease/intein/homing endonuclease
MSTIVQEKDLPAELTPQQAVESAYSRELAEVASKLQRGLPCLVECDKDLAPFLFMNLRTRLREANLRCVYLDGRPREGEQQQGPMPMGLMGTMIAQLRDAVRGAVERRVIVLPHLDLLTTSQGGLTGEAREVIVLLYENPEIVWLGFKDPSFPLPKVIENLFPHRISMLGTARDRLRHLVTQRESRKFGKPFNPWALYKYVSGVNAVRLRRLLSTLEGEDFPSDPKLAYRQLRQATLTGSLEIPEVSLEKDIGGYDKVKQRLRQEILDVLARRDAATNEEEVARLEELIPRGMIFWGPPGTGKTFFAKAMAAAIGAAITVVSGPELKSKWVGESLPYDEEVFVILNGQAVRIPIGDLVENHAHDDVRTWTVRDDGTAILAPVIGFLKHKGPDYIDVLLTETGREVRVTGGHSLFVEQDGKLAEVFAEQVEPGKTRVAVPLRLEAPETVRELNLLDLLAGREDVYVRGYDGAVADAIARIGEARADACTGVAVRRLSYKQQRPPLSVAAFQRLTAEAGTEPDPTQLLVRRKARGISLPAVLPLTEDLGEFLGNWVADGCYSNTGVRLATNRDDADYYAALCERLFGHVTRYAKGERGVDLYINCTLLRQVMRDGLGMQDGSGRKRVPPFIFLASLPVIAAFLRGYFSGDGTFTGKYVESSTVNRELAHDIVTLLQYFGIAARIRTKSEWNGSTSYRVRFLWTGFLRKFLDRIGFADKRRNDALRAYLDTMTFRRKLQTPEGHITNDVLWDKVVEKRREPYAREHVYDLSVPETERFIAGFGNVLVHNSEENLRQIFYRARQSAPSIIVFDEMDSFASARGTYTGSGVEHSMVNQLLTEMDGFHKEELVFVVGTTNFVEILDPALLRPGRFEFHLYIPYPEPADRREILKIYDQKMRLKMSPEALEFAVKRTNDHVIGAAGGTRYSGDHLNALCRSVARLRLRDARTDETKPADVERALTEFVERPKMAPGEELVLATHEAGHAVVSLFCPNAPPIERVTIASEMQWAFGYVKHQDPAHKYVQTINFYLDMMCVALGAREAERMLLKDISLGAVADLESATGIARELVEVHGWGGEKLGLVQYFDRQKGGRREDLAATTLEAIDERVRDLVEEQRRRSATILKENRAVLETLRDLLLKHKTIDAKTLTEMAPDQEAKRKPSQVV